MYTAITTSGCPATKRASAERLRRPTGGQASRTFRARAFSSQWTSSRRAWLGEDQPPDGAVLGADLREGSAAVPQRFPLLVPVHEKMFKIASKTVAWYAVDLRDYDLQMSVR
ncbi:hypothetical protein [Kitasatospora purpeofusca]|uniref:hypothetical protein n=1 Tax=Kitasatospora purpeofusca TaxID=67352 RepID=UPI003867B024